MHVVRHALEAELGDSAALAACGNLLQPLAVRVRDRDVCTPPNEVDRGQRAPADRGVVGLKRIDETATIDVPRVDAATIDVPRVDAAEIPRVLRRIPCEL